jgi:glyoxylase-like metal-dependent hydrolase (beta-lactamase superfamily II)
MNLSRRQMLGAAITAPIVLKFAILPAVAQTTAQVVALQRVRAGDAVGTAISDGFLEIDVAYLSNITPDQANAALAAEFIKASPVATGVNAYLVSMGDRTILVDSGGAGYAPALGKLLPGLEVAGVSPDQIDAILLTHLHVDHVGGLVTAGKATFPNAELHIHANDVAYFSSADNRAATPDAFRVSFDKAQEALAVYEGRVRTFSGDTEIPPGIRSRELFGHTPGHSGFVVGQGEDALFIWGDIIHVGPIQFAKPDVGIAYDVDGETAIATRKDVLRQVAADRTRIAGMHINFPGIGHVKPLASGKGYDFEPASWTYALD